MQEEVEKAKLKATGWVAIAAKNITPEKSLEVETANRKIKEDSEARKNRLAEKKENKRQKANDECIFLRCLLYKKIMAEDIAYYNQLEIEYQRKIKYQLWREEKTQEECAMKTQLEYQEITQDDYDLWKMEKVEEEMEYNYAYHMEGVRLYER